MKRLTPTERAEAEALEHRYPKSAAFWFWTVRAMLALGVMGFGFAVLYLVTVAVTHV